LCKLWLSAEHLSMYLDTSHNSATQHHCFTANHNVIFIDASWRKALKIWKLNPWLQLCSSWHFTNPPDSQYHIRRTTQESSLSTLESVVYVLEHTHNINCMPLLTLFLKMQERCFIENTSSKSNKIT